MFRKIRYFSFSFLTFSMLSLCHGCLYKLPQNGETDEVPYSLKKEKRGKEFFPKENEKPLESKKVFRVET